MFAFVYMYVSVCVFVHLDLLVYACVNVPKNGIFANVRACVCMYLYVKQNLFVVKKSICV